MATDVKLPDLGEGVDSAEVINVLVKVGDAIKAEQSIIEIETDKASVEVPSSAAGKVTQVHVEVGATVKTGDLLLTLEAGEEKKEEPETEVVEKAGEEDTGAAQDAEAEAQPEEAEAAEELENKAATGRKPSEAKPKEAPEEKPEAGEKQAGALSVSTVGAEVAASPRVRKLARQLGVDLSRVKSTAGGRITEDDLYAAVRDRGEGESKGEASPTDKAEPKKSGGESDAWGPIRRERLSKVRATIARKMHESWTAIPRVTHFDDADITELEEFRQERKGDLGEDVKLTLMPFIVRATAEALKKHPKVNASLDLDAGEIVYHDYVNIGIAIDTDRGLVVPVLRDVDQRGIAQLATDIAELAVRTRDADFTVDDLRGGTFTISNQGAVGGQYATPIINHPQAAILLLGRGKQQPAVTDDGRIEPRLIMPLSFSYDHRLIDGADAGRFVNALKDLLQYPGKLLLSL